MDNFLNMKQKGIASLFDKEELKKFFKNYLSLIAIAETFVFFASFISQLGPENTPFPWESYFFAAFIIPIAITFLLGVCIMGFNTYLFDDAPPENEADHGLSLSRQSGFLAKLNYFLHSLRQVPALLGLGLLGLCGAVFYKIDDILTMVGHAGEKTAQYILISLAIVLSAACIFGLAWILLKFLLRRKEIEYQYRFKKEVVESTGLIIMDDNSIIDKKGNLVSSGNLPALGAGTKETGPLTLLSHIKGKEGEKEEENRDRENIA